ncbi:hypothetical protein K469DRAFT_322271 [Zopfia rhizophila CBS 207.26]|uniref:Uncharacterized protein n=1 Tax=Zopfia rhizophila CBS 207.26 TaxID=1314779 RepID=A0A6A6DLJ5_9PEZI|nr:hypothetical protein K469DRAFT_322271 [Zopfia rhizophila CBS 207.26]
MQYPVAVVVRKLIGSGFISRQSLIVCEPLLKLSLGAKTIGRLTQSISSRLHSCLSPSLLHSLLRLDLCCQFLPKVVVNFKRPTPFTARSNVIYSKSAEGYEKNSGSETMTSLHSTIRISLVPAKHLWTMTRFSSPLESCLMRWRPNLRTVKYNVSLCIFLKLHRTEAGKRSVHVA